MPKNDYFRLGAGLALLSVVVFLAGRWFPAPSPSSTPLNGFAASSSYVAISSGAMTPFRAMYYVPRAKYGFTPLPRKTDVKIEQLTGASAVAAGYDVLLHISPAANDRFSIERTVAFKRVRGQFRWIGEQETWTGPHQYKLPDGGMTNETLSISYSTQPGAGVGIVNALEIEYAGDDPRLSGGMGIGRDSLGLKDIKPVLKQWGAI